jgi:putative transposase
MIHLRFLDEAGVYTTAPNGYCWREKGQPLEIPKNGHGRKLNLIGSVDYVTGEADYEVHLENIGSATVLSYLQKLAKVTLESGKKMLVVMDNASWHCSGFILSERLELLKSGLMVAYLPVYSPELNLMETVWRSLKYRLLPRCFYDTLGELENDVLAVMDQICVKGVRV